MSRTAEQARSGSGPIGVVLVFALVLVIAAVRIFVPEAENVVLVGIAVVGGALIVAWRRLSLLGG